MHSVLATFPVLAPPSEGPVDIGFGVKSPEAFTLLLGEGGAAVADTAEPQVVSIEPAIVATGLVPPQFWMAIHLPSDLPPAPETKLAHAVPGEALDENLSQDASHDSPTPAVRSLPDAAGSAMAANAAFPTIGPSGTTTRHPANDIVADRGAGKALEPIIETAVPKLPGPELAVAVGGGADEADGQHIDAVKPVPLEPAAHVPHREGVQLRPDGQPLAAKPMDALDQITSAFIVDQRPTPGGSAPASPPIPAARAKGPESGQPAPFTPGIDAAEPLPTARPEDPDPTRVLVRPETAPRLHADKLTLIATPDMTSRAAAKHGSATVLDAPKTAVTDPMAPIPAPAPTGGIWERIITDLAEPAGPAGPTMGPKTVLPGQFAGSEGFDVPLDRVWEPATEAGRMGATAPAPDPEIVRTPPVSPTLPSTLISTATAPSPVTAAFDPSEPPDADTGFFTSAMPAFPISAGSGTAAAATSMPVIQVAAQIAGALGRTSDGATELALAPEELGLVRLRLEPDAANPDRMVIMIIFERPETLDLFRRHAGELAEAIKNAGYSGADIGFEQDGGGRDPDRHHEPHNTGFAGSSDQPPPTASTPRLAAGTSLDLRL